MAELLIQMIYVQKKNLQNTLDVQKWYNLFIQILIFGPLKGLKKNPGDFKVYSDLTGKTFVRDKQGNKTKGPFLKGTLDIDSEAAYRKCQTELENDWMHNTYVTKTRKPFGRHVDWFEDWKDEYDEFVSIRGSDCKPGCEFEVMVEFNYTQLLGQHREDSNFWYEGIGCLDLNELRIMHRNGFYENKLLDMFKSLLIDPDFKKHRKSHYKEREKELELVNLSSIGSLILTPYSINSISLWAEQFYLPGKRYYFMRAFLGTLTWKWVSLESGFKIIDKICSDKGNPGDKEKWYELLKDAQQDIINELRIEGRHVLKRILMRDSTVDEKRATEQIEMLISFIRIDDDDNTNTSPASVTANETEEQYDERLAKERLTEKDRDFVIEVMTKQAPYDKVSILQLFHGYNSAFTKCPIPHIVNSRDAGAGKTYLSSFVVGYYPQKYVLAFAGASDKALFHKDGIMVIPKINNETGEEEVEPIAPIISELKSQKKILEKQDTSDNKIKIKEIEEEINDIESRAEKLIILDNTIFLFLDTPQEALISALFTLISQDIPRDQKYFFADKSAFGRIGSKFNRLRGSPAVFTTRVLDDTRGERFAEKNRRFINVNPDTTAKKIRCANELIGLKYGCLPEQYR